MIGSDIIIAILTALNGACAFRFEQSTVNPTYDSPANPLTACSTNPVATDGTEIVPVATVSCGDSVSGDTSGTVADGNNGLGTCGTSPGNHGLWYKFEDAATCYNAVTFAVCTANYDTKIQVWDDADCSGGTPTCEGGNDDNCGLQSSIQLAPEDISRRYFVWVSGFSANTGTFTLDVTCEEIDLCAAEITACSTNPTATDGTEILPVGTLSCGDSVSGDTSGTPAVSNNGLGTCTTSAGEHGAWYKFEDTDTCFNTVVFDVCNAGYDTKIQVWDDANCSGGAPSCVLGNDDACGLQSRVTLADATRRYYVWVTGFMTQAGTFTLNAVCTLQR